MVVFNHITFVNCVGVVLNLRTSFSPFGIGIFGGQNSLKNQDFDSQPNSTKLLVEEAQPFEPNQTKLPCQPVGGPNSIQTKVNPGVELGSPFVVRHIRPYDYAGCEFHCPRNWQFS